MEQQYEKDNGDSSHNPEDLKENVLQGPGLNTI